MFWKYFYEDDIRPEIQVAPRYLLALQYMDSKVYFSHVSLKYINISTMYVWYLETDIHGR